MSHVNVALAQRLYDAFAIRDFEEIARWMAPTVAVEQSAEIPWGGRFDGPDGVARFLQTLCRHVTSHVDIERMIDAGDHVVAIGRTRGVAIATGRSFDVPLVHVWQFDDGKVKRFSPFLENRAILAALAAEAKA